jgi:ATP-binding cassette subfamily B protein
LRSAGVRPVTALALLYLGRSLLPAASALLMAILVARLEHGTQPWTVLAGFVAVLLAGHLSDAFVQPLAALVKARVDGAQRAEVARLTSTSDTITALEDPDVRDLVRLASADPDNWTEKTPGDGAVAQLGMLFRWVGAIGAGAVLAGYAWWLLPVLLIPTLAARSVNRRLFLRFTRRWASGARLARRADSWREVMRSPAGGKEQRVYGLAGWAVERQASAIHLMFDPLWAMARRNRVVLWLETALLILPLAGVYALTASDAAQGRISVAVLTAVLGAAFAVYQSFSGSYDALEIENARPVLAAVGQLREALGRPAQPAAAAGAVKATGTVPDTGAPLACGAAPLVELRGIRYAYPGSDRPVLDGLNLTIRPGELLAIVGLNGAGKSTLIKLLSGLYRPDAGTITVDGVDLDTVGAAAWWERISVVFQDFVRYHLTAAQNVTLGHATVPVDRRAIDAAAEEAGLGGVLTELPDGWDTPLARDRTDGVDLSGGQWQQVVLTQALYAVRTGAGLLVLDEPTAHLDVRSEQELFDKLLGRRGRTSIVLISHRLSTVRQADRIVLLDGGRITESGSHEELMARGGGYAEMFTIQADRFRRGFDDRTEDGEL